MAKSKLKPNSVSTPKKLNLNLNTVSLVTAIAAIFVGIVFFGIKNCPNRLLQEGPSSLVVQKPNKSQKIYWFHTQDKQDYYLKEVFTVLETLGYEKGTNSSDWDLLWAFHWPFDVFHKEMTNLKPYQKVNHFPGTGVITTKVNFATSGLEYIPPAFRLPDDKQKLIEYSKKNPQASFVLKDNYHRKIKLAKIDEIDLNQGSNFIQEYIDRPLLVDGHKFDIGVYTIITSVEPLRIYVYNEDIVARFCPEKYYPFDPDNLKKYIIGDDYFPIWDVPGLDYYYNKLGYSKKETVNAYLQRQEIDTDDIWRQIEDAIVKFVLAKESHIVEALKQYPSKRNFFEMMRFDFVVDEKLKVNMLESNMSPNLSAEKYAVSKLLYHQVLYHLFGLVGVGDRLNRTSFAPRSKSEEEMIVAEKNLVTFANICNSEKCKTNCILIECQLCKPCLTEETREFLTEAVREHMDRGECKRIFPPQMTQEEALKGADLSKLTKHNQIQYRWFEGKCIHDKTWC